LNVRRSFFLIAATLLAAACNPPAPAPRVAPENVGELRYLVDPRLGFAKPAPPAIDKRFDAAWKLVLAGDFAEARRRLDDVIARAPNFLPARLAEAAIDIAGNHPEAARPVVDKLLNADSAWTAARIYDAELAIAEHQPERAYEIYRAIAAGPNAPATATERTAELSKQLFENSFAAAQAASGEESVRLLHTALAFEPAARPARMLLVQRLLGLRRFDEARRELDPLIASEADNNEVQEALAEIDAGTGRYQEAIVRYERLARHTSDPRYMHRLDELKQQFAAANMPPQYQRAFESESITRADLAVLMYWKIASIRFAQNLGAPPIAIDIGEIPGRDELIRAIALGIFTVDPVTRRVNPNSPVNSASLVRVAARALILRGASCVKQAETAPGDVGRAENVLAACGVTDPSLIGLDDPVNGRQAAAVMEQVDGALSR